MQQLEADMGVMCEGGNRCTRQATYIVTIHPIDECGGGDKVFLLCPDCIGWVAETMSTLIDELDSFTCNTCDRLVDELHHVFSVELLVWR